MQSRRHRRHLFAPETSALATDQPSLHGVPDLVMLTPTSSDWRFLCFGFLFKSGLFILSVRLCCFLDGVASSDSQTGKQHLSFVNKGKYYCLKHLFYFLLRTFFSCWSDVWFYIFIACCSDLQVAGAIQSLVTRIAGELFGTLTATSFLLAIFHMTLMKTSSKSFLWVCF